MAGIDGNYFSIGNSATTQDSESMTRDVLLEPQLTAHSDIYAMNECCPVCGDKVSGYHYGLLTCESCKGFFKRTVQNKKVYSCVESKNCVIDKTQRKRCPFCRYEKCLKVGMRLDAVRTDRMRGGRNKFGPMYKQDRARKQQIQAFHRATGFLNILDGRQVHSGLEKRIFYPIPEYSPDSNRQQLLNDAIGITKDGSQPYKDVADQMYFSNPALPTSNITDEDTDSSKNGHTNYNNYNNNSITINSRAGGYIMNSNTLHVPNLMKSPKERNGDLDFHNLVNRTLYGSDNATDLEKSATCEFLKNRTLFEVRTKESEIIPSSERDNIRQIVPPHQPQILLCSSPQLFRSKSECNLSRSIQHRQLGLSQRLSFQFHGESAPILSPIVPERYLELTKEPLHQSFPLSTIPHLRQPSLLSELRLNEVNHRTISDIHLKPDQVFRYICEIANQTLFMIVEWAKSSSHFKQLETSDQMTLLQKGWMDILVLDHVYRQVNISTDTIILANGHTYLHDAYDKYVSQHYTDKQEEDFVKNIIQRSRELTMKFKNLHLDKMEFNCLKFLILFNADASSVCRVHLRMAQSTFNEALWQHSHRHGSSNTDRVGQLLYTLSEVRTLSLHCEEYLFKQFQQGNTPKNNLLIEMLHAKRNVATR
ncbi:steroidogenic factor 1-like [Styela clava]|uniref:nuclear receptor subfamily 5 group A member 2-like n=1 Tax=Styela clava TaxID=7725 RepID=UPI001939B621|nr:nuclear receptor subfamily 5 group A member 2-like [Styela clava]